MIDYIPRKSAIEIVNTPNYDIHDMSFALKAMPAKLVPDADDISRAYQDGFNDGVDSIVPCEWSYEMPTESGWYWAVTDLSGEVPEIFPCYYDARYNDIQSIERGTACVVGILATMPMQFPTLPNDAVEYHA